VISYNCSTELRNVFVKVNQVFGLLSIHNVVEVNVLVAPLKVMDDPPVSQFLLHDEKRLEEFYNVFFNINMVILSDHCFLILEVRLILSY
jgi:hypothetical protein